MSLDLACSLHPWDMYLLVTQISVNNNVKYKVTHHEKHTVFCFLWFELLVYSPCGCMLVCQGRQSTTYWVNFQQCHVMSLFICWTLLLFTCTWQLYASYCVLKVCMGTYFHLIELFASQILGNKEHTQCLCQAFKHSLWENICTHIFSSHSHHDVLKQSNLCAAHMQTRVFQYSSQRISFL